MENDIFIFKNFKMGDELEIAGEFIYESARRMMSIGSFHNSFEINSILYNGAVGIERVQKVLLCMLKINSSDDYDKEKNAKVLKGHNHLDLQNEIQKVCSDLNVSKTQRSMLGVFQDYYNNYRYSDYLLESDYDLKKLFINFLGKYKKMDFDIPHTDHEYEFFKKKYINDLGSMSKVFFKKIREVAHNSNMYTYELDTSGYGNAFKVFYGDNDLVSDLKLERNAIGELLVSLYNSKFDSNFGKYLNDFKPIDIDDSMIQTYIYDLLNFRVNDSLVGYVEAEYEELNKKDRTIRKDLIELLGSRDVMWDFGEDIEDEE